MGQGKPSKEEVRTSPEAKRRRLPWQKAHQACGNDGKCDPLDTKPQNEQKVHYTEIPKDVIHSASQDSQEVRGDTSTDHGNIVLTENDDFLDILNATNTLKARYYQFGIHLGLPPYELDAIREQFPHDIAQAFTQMLLLWLRQRYNVERYGPPTWQTLVKAVEHEIPALAKTISAKHLHPGPDETPVLDVKHEVHQDKQKCEDLATDATDVGHEQQDEQKCENLVTNATEMNHETHGQQDEQRCEDLVTDATDVGHEQQDEQKCENLVTNATEMNHEAHGQQDEQRCEDLATDATDVGHEQQDEQKCENLVTNATEMNHEAHGQQDEQRCENLVTDATDVEREAQQDGEILTDTTDVSREAHEQQDELTRKSLSQLQKDEREKQERIDNMFMNLRSAETVGVCFLIDHTVSTGPWINKVKDVRCWSEQLRVNHTHLELHVAFVHYTDYDQPPYTHVTTLDFTTDLEKFYHFVDKLVLPTGTRQDRAEDVFGGLDAMLSLSWQRVGTKVLVHLADAPCHGMQYHNSSINDDYPDGDPGGHDLDDLMKQLADKQIAYHFGYINKSHTLTMIMAFNSSLLAQSHRRFSIQQLDSFQESDLAENIFQSVTTSIDATLEGLLMSTDRYLREYIIDESIPQWDSLDLPVQQVMVKPPPTPGVLGTLEHPKTPMSVKMAPQPFAVGTQRIAYHALDMSQNCQLVIKRSKWADERSICLKRCLETANVHAIAALLFIQFKEEMLALPVKVNMEAVTPGTVGVMQWIDNGQEHNFTYEAYIGSSDYTKFNSSFACIPESKDYELNIVCQAFSHYTWVRSGEQLIVCDLQGKRVGPRVILTDPVIHDSVSVLHHGTTNLGEKGIQRFFQLHKCNRICQAMQLEHPLSSCS